MDCSPPGFSVHGLLQARILEWVATSSSRGSSQPRDWTLVSCIEGRFFTIWATSNFVHKSRWLDSTVSRLWRAPNCLQIFTETALTPHYLRNQHRSRIGISRFFMTWLGKHQDTWQGRFLPLKKHVSILDTLTYIPSSFILNLYPDVLQNPGRRQSTVVLEVNQNRHAPKALG